MAKRICPCGHQIDLDERSLRFFIVPKLWFDVFIETVNKLRQAARDDEEFSDGVGSALSGSYDSKRPKIVECPVCGRLLVYRNDSMVSYAPEPVRGERQPLQALFPAPEQSLGMVTELSPRYPLSRFSLRKDLSIAELRRTIGKESLIESFSDYSRTADGKVVVSDLPRKFYEYHLEDDRYLALHFAEPNEDQLVSAATIDAKTGDRTPIWPSE